MAKQLPPPADFGRHIDPIEGKSTGNLADVEALPKDAIFVENADGSVDVMSKKDEKPDNSHDDFHANLAETIPESGLSHIAIELLDLIDKDKEARSKRDEQYAEGIKRTGLGNDAPGGATFEGASKAVHPLLAEGCIDFAARAMKELFPASGPVKTHIIGDITDEKIEKADRKKLYMNYQLTGSGAKCIKEYRSELEQLLTQLPLGGSQYMKIWHDDQLMRHKAEFVPIDDILLPYSATSFQSAGRATHQQMISRNEFEHRIEGGLYREISYSAPPITGDQTESEKASNKIEGRDDGMSYNEDGMRRVFEIYTDFQLDGDGFTDGKVAPYIITIDEPTGKVLAIYRNWDEDDETRVGLEWIVDFSFIPWRGAYAVGLPHLIGSLSGAATGGIRALLDSAHINNAATMLKLKGNRTAGQNLQVEVTEVCEIEGPAGCDDIRKLAMPMPFSPPSAVLFNMVQWLVSEARGVVATAEEAIKDQSPNMPVGTALALIEQGSQVFSAIHARLHDSQRRCLAIIHRLNGTYLEDKETVEELGELIVTQQDFQGPMDIQPVSDPNIFSDTQRYAQLQAAMQLADKYPQLYKLDKLNERALRLLNFPNFDEVLVDIEDPEQTDPVTENKLAATGERPLKVYPTQDHVGHLTSHIAFMTSPLFCLNPVMANPTLPNLIKHCRDHLLEEYVNQARAALAAGMEIAPTPEDAAKYSSALADQALAQKLGDLMQHLETAAQQQGKLIQPPPPADPNAAVNLQIGMAEIQRKTQATQADNAMKQQVEQMRDQAAQQTEQLRAQAEQQAAQLRDAADQRAAESDARLKNLQAQLDDQQQARQAQIDEQNAIRQHINDQQQAFMEHQRISEETRMKMIADLLKNENDNHTRVLVAEMAATKQAITDDMSQQQQAITALVTSLQDASADQKVGLFQRLKSQFGGGGTPS